MACRKRGSGVTAARSFWAKKIWLPGWFYHRSSGQAIVTIASRDHYLSPHGTKASRIEYNRLIPEWLAAGRSNSIAAQNGISICELIALYWGHAKRRYIKKGRPTSKRNLFGS
jgi:hypothetical protein